MSDPRFFLTKAVTWTQKNNVENYSIYVLFICVNIVKTAPISQKCAKKN